MAFRNDPSSKLRSVGPPQALKAAQIRVETHKRDTSNLETATTSRPHVDKFQLVVDWMPLRARLVVLSRRHMSTTCRRHAAYLPMGETGRLKRRLMSTAAADLVLIGRKAVFRLELGRGLPKSLGVTRPCCFP